MEKVLPCMLLQVSDAYRLERSKWEGIPGGLSGSALPARNTGRPSSARRW
jgi:hypothetical protein